MEFPGDGGRRGLCAARNPAYVYSRVHRGGVPISFLELCRGVGNLRACNSGMSRPISMTAKFPGASRPIFREIRHHCPALPCPASSAGREKPPLPGSGGHAARITTRCPHHYPLPASLPAVSPPQSISARCFPASCLLPAVCPALSLCLAPCPLSAPPSPSAPCHGKP